jgi:hypothetical protein
MRLLNPRLKSLSEGETVVACEVLVDAGKAIDALLAEVRQINNTPNER